MPRPPKCRRVEFEPRYTYFKPAGVPKWQLEELVLNVEEIEAIRLKDLEGLEQEDCAERMHISRPTFQRVLTSGRKKLAEAIIAGKAIRIEGGNYRVTDGLKICLSCREEFYSSHHQGQQDQKNCPKCEEKALTGIKKED